MGHENIRKSRESLRVSVYVLSLFIHLFLFFTHISNFKTPSSSSSFSSSRFTLIKPSKAATTTTASNSNSPQLPLAVFHVILSKNLFFSQMGGSGRWLKSLISLRRPSPTDQVCKFFLGFFFFFLLMFGCGDVYLVYFCIFFSGEGWWQE